MLDFKVQKIQFALFPKNFNPIDKSKIASELKSKTGGIFDGPETILPLPIDAPLEIPRIMLQSKNGEYVCNIAIPRIDLFQNVNASKKFEEVKDEFLDKVKKVASYFIQDQGITIGRMGFVVEFIADTEKSPAILLRDNLIKDGAYFKSIEKIRSVLLAFTENYTLGDFELNKQIMFDSLKSTTSKEFLLLRYDNNTLAEKFNENNIKFESILQIIEKSTEDMTSEKLNNLLSIKKDE